ncbi:MAG: sugar-binding domain-containing protein [Aerococcaceae bacterium]|nr:sugar-binding domain-containing protein [Aerococcaceae bacterium]
MENVFSLIQMIMPQVSIEFHQRLQVLKVLSQQSDDVGRKWLAQAVNLSERSLRTLLERLKEQNLVAVNRSGICLTDYGRRILQEMEALLAESHRFYEMEQQLKQYLKIEHCCIVAGDADLDERVYYLLGQEVQRLLTRQLDKGKNVIAVTGGSTLSKIGHSFTPELSTERQLIFVPARGGVGGSYDIQSNSVGGFMANQTHSQYVPLFVPENVDERMSKVLLTDPSIKHAIDLSKQANCLMLSVGTSQRMAERHDVSPEQLQHLETQRAIGEVFGVFFDRDGREVMKLPRYGIQLEDLKEIPLLVTIVGGASKAEAMQAHYKIVPNHGWLICDEGIATKVLSGIKTR